jgi:hypothetical protein
MSFDATEADFKLLDLKIKKLTPYKCEVCEKAFENETILKGHMVKCFLVNKKSEYGCAMCNAEFTTIKQYNHHKMSKMHIDNISAIEVEDIGDADMDEHIKLDPFLSDTDKKELDSGIGGGFTVAFSDGQSYKLDYNFNETNTNPNTNTNTNTDTDTDTDTNIKSINLKSTNIKAINSKNDLLKTFEKKVDERTKESIITDNQQKLLLFMVKISGRDNNHKLFYRALDALTLPDYKGLSKLIIESSDINVNEKQKYIQVMRLYKEQLVKLYNAGNTNVYKGMQLKPLLDSITF